MLTLDECVKCVTDRENKKEVKPIVSMYGIGVMSGGHQRNDSRMIVCYKEGKQELLQLTDYRVPDEKIRLFLHPVTFNTKILDKVYGMVNLTSEEMNFVESEFERLEWTS